MDEKQLQEQTPEEQTAEELQEFSLEDIMKEFGGMDPETPEQEEAQPEEAAEEPVTFREEAAQEVSEEAQSQEAVSGGDTIRMDVAEFGHGQVHNAAPVEEETPEPEAQEEAFSGQWEPEYEQPMGEYVPPQPIIIHPRSRLRELKRKLVAGPEKRYYKLAELGVGKLQVAIFLSFLLTIIAAGTTVLYAMGRVPEDRMKLMVFSQFFIMLIAALLGSFQLIEGVADVFKKRFSLNTLLVITFILSCVDGVFCLQQLRVPCCAAFTLEVTMSLWNTYQRRHAEMGMMDTMRKAIHLDSIYACEEFYEGKSGLMRTEGQVEDFMDHYRTPSVYEKTMSWYALGALVAAAAIGVVAGLLSDVYTGIQLAAVSLVAAVPATAFITFSRPMAILERRLHAVGTVLCGWRGIRGLCGKVVFPLRFEDLFPAGTVKMHGVKFYGSRQPEEVLAYCTALIEGSGSGLTPVFQQVLDSRNGRHYDAVNLRAYENGGIGGEVQGEPVLVGSLSFLKEMGVEIPDGIRVNQAVCVSIDGELSGLFAVTYDKNRAASSGLATLCGSRKVSPVLISDDFMLTESFLREHFGFAPKRMAFPDREQRLQLQGVKPEQPGPALMLCTREGLASAAYGAVGARSLKRAWTGGLIIHMIGGIAGLGIMLLLTLIGRLDLLTPVNMFIYQLIWLIPGFLATTWVKSL